MRGHVAWHILTEDLVGHCRYCGRGGSCTSVLKKAARKMGKQYYKVESNCSYFVQLIKTPKKFTRNVRCTNHLMRCRLCPQETGVWKYSLLQHFEQFHEGCDLLHEEVLGDDERDHIINNC